MQDQATPGFIGVAAQLRQQLEAEQAASERGTSEIAAPLGSLSTGDWFAIRGNWLHVNSERFNLRAITYYRDGGNCVNFYIAGQYQQSVFVTDADGEPWGSRAKQLLAALDAFFANDKLTDRGANNQ